MVASYIFSLISDSLPMRYSSGKMGTITIPFFFILPQRSYHLSTKLPSPKKQAIVSRFLAAAFLFAPLGSACCPSRCSVVFLQSASTPPLFPDSYLLSHRFLQNQPAIEAAQKGKIHLFFLDAAHFVLQPFLCCLWCMVRVFIKAASGRNRINVLGAVHAISKKIVTLTNTTYITADTLIEFLKLLKKKFYDRPIVIVLDNARYQSRLRRNLIVEAMAKKLGIELLFLPPYSPNLNIIERLCLASGENQKENPLCKIL